MNKSKKWQKHHRHAEAFKFAPQATVGLGKLILDSLYRNTHFIGYLGMTQTVALAQQKYAPTPLGQRLYGPPQGGIALRGVDFLIAHLGHFGHRCRTPSAVAQPVQSLVAHSGVCV